jgi:hypothetical protein
LSQVYNECTCCYRALTADEIKKHEKLENFYYTICDDCVEKVGKRLIKIVYQQPKE